MHVNEPHLHHTQISLLLHSKLDKHHARQAHLLCPFADVPLDGVLKGGFVVQLKEVSEGAKVVQKEAYGDEARDEVFQFDAGHPPDQTDHVDRRRYWENFKSPCFSFPQRSLSHDLII